jgi:hypothetical protein
VVELLRQLVQRQTHKPAKTHRIERWEEPIELPQQAVLVEIGRGATVLPGDQRSRFKPLDEFCDTNDLDTVRPQPARATARTTYLEQQGVGESPIPRKVFHVMNVLLCDLPVHEPNAAGARPPHWGDLDEELVVVGATVPAKNAESRLGEQKLAELSSLLARKGVEVADVEVSEGLRATSRWRRPHQPALGRDTRDSFAWRLDVDDRDAARDRLFSGPGEPVFSPRSKYPITTRPPCFGPRVPLGSQNWLRRGVRRGTP